MRILIAGTTYAPALNGQSSFTTNLAEGMAVRGHEVWVITPSDQGKAYQIEHKGVHIWTVSATEMKFVHNQAYAAIFPDADVKRLFDRFKPDIVHLQDHYPLNRCVLKYARRAGLPVMGTNHFVPENLAPYVPLLPRLWPVFSRLLWWWSKRVYDHLDMITAPSVTAVKILEAQNLHPPIYPVSCGVSFTRFHPDSNVESALIRARYGISRDCVTFLFVGRVDGEKRVDVLIRALKLLDRGDIQLVVTGNGAALHSYQALVEELGLQGKVRFTGFVIENDLPQLLNRVDIFVMPSEAELLSIASLEAMASGRPLLVARSKALPELVTDGLNGFLFEPGNIEDAARCMAAFADHPERWATMGAASLEKVQSHRIENVLSRYEELYRLCQTTGKSSSVLDR